MKNTFIILVVFFYQLTSSSEAFATNFKNGYIITLQMDTLYGQINNDTYQENALKCIFRTNSKDTIRSFSPNDLFGYRFIDGKFYIARYVPQQQRTIFLEYLIKGSLDVYFQQLEGHVNAFYVAKDTLPLRLLKYEVKDVYEDGLHFQQLYNSSQIVLEYYTSDCPEVKEVIKKIRKPEHETLIRLATEYHQRVCPNRSCQVFEKKMPSKMFLTASLGQGTYPLSWKLSLKDYGTQSSYSYLSNAASVLFQQPWISESTYFGIGYADFKRIPVSIYHIPEGKRIMPISGYELDLNYFSMVQNLTLGLRLPINKWSITLTGNMTTFLFITPIACSARLGVMYQLR